MKRVLTTDSRNCGCDNTFRMNGMFVFTPRILGRVRGEAGVKEAPELGEGPAHLAGGVLEGHALPYHLHQEAGGERCQGEGGVGWGWVRWWG